MNEEVFAWSVVILLLVVMIEKLVLLIMTSFKIAKCLFSRRKEDLQVTTPY